MTWGRRVGGDELESTSPGSGDSGRGGATTTTMEVEENHKPAKWKRASTRKWASDSSEEDEDEEDEDEEERALPKKKGKATTTLGGIATTTTMPRKKHKGAGANSGNSATLEYTWTTLDGKAPWKNSNISTSIATLNGEAVRNHSWPHYHQLPNGTYHKCSHTLPSHLGVVV